MSAHTPGPWAAHFTHPEDSCAYVKTEGYPRGIYAGEVSILYGEKERRNANAHLIAAAPDLLAAAEAHLAWTWAEDQHDLATFSERMELCSYAEWLTRRAVDKASGAAAGEEYVGVPRLIVWPSVYLDRADADRAKAIVDRLLAAYRAAIAKAAQTDAEPNTRSSP